MGTTRRKFLRSCGALAATSQGVSLLGGCETLSASARGRRPNILLIMTDDQGYGDIRSHGNDKIDTPVLDQLAADGVRFNRFYVSSVCSPTRASLLTGRYSQRTGVHGVTRAQETMRADEVTIAQLFKRAGYATGCFGKWHNGAHMPYHPNGKGFDEFVGFCAGHWNNYFDTTLERNGALFKSQGYMTDFLTDEAIGFIRKHRSEPFLCYVPYNAPHSPWQVPDRYFDKYKKRGLDDTTACAYAMVENIDDNVGRLLDELDRLKPARETIVLFLTDNGANSDRYNDAMKGRKGSSDEGGIRVPLFVRWSGRIPAGVEVEQIAAHVDVLPTLCDLAGVPVPRGLKIDGVSLRPLAEASAEAWPDRMLFSNWRTHGSVRTQRWRAVMRNNGEWQLYDMQGDPGQKVDTARRHPDTLAKLKSAYEDWYADVCEKGFDQIAAPIGHPQRDEVTLPGHEALLHPGQGKGINYAGRSGWANDWVTDWTRSDAYPYWEVDVVRPGRYEVVLMVVCPEARVGTELRVEIGSASAQVVVGQAHDPKPLPSPDRVARKEVYEKVWAPVEVGTMRLAKGPTRLVVRTTHMLGGGSIDLKAVRLRRLGA